MLRSLQFRRELGHQILDLFRVAAIANQDGIACPDDDKIVHAEQSDLGRVFG